MVKINVLLENFAINEQYKSKHGLSLLINYCDNDILLDVGPDRNFIKNAKNMNVDLAKVKYLFLSHNHSDHTGGLNCFIKENNCANIYLMDNPKNEYYIRFFFLNIPINKPLGLKLNKKNNSKIIQLNDSLFIDNKIYFMKNTHSAYKKPTFNNVLFKREDGKIVNDKFEHEGILVLEDNDELLIFNSCSHNGILNTIETVKTNIPDKKIKCYVGGLHLFNPTTKEHENNVYLDYLINKIKKTNIKIYTGHCTGKYALDYMKKKLGGMIQEINTGMKINI